MTPVPTKAPLASYNGGNNGAQLPEAEAAVMEIQVDTEAIRVVPWQEVLKQEMSDRLK